MKKKILSMILAIAMVVSMFAGITIIAHAAEGTYQFADSIAAGDTVIMANPDGTRVFTGISAKNTGDCIEATPSGNTLVSADAAQLTVEAGAAEGTIALKMADGMYIGWSSGNTIKAMESVGEATSWTYMVDEEGKASLVCLKLDGTKERKLQYNSGSPRFCAYTSNQAGIALFKLAEGDVCVHTDATGEVTTAATCTDAGVMTYICSCGHTWEETIAATGHDYDEGVVTNAATCTETGVKTYTCTACGATKEETIAAIGHNFVEGVCSVCGVAKGEAVNYSLIDLDTIVEGNYVIAAVLGGEYPTVYPATSKITTGSNFDWGVSATAVTANEDVISSDDLAEDAQVFAFKGNNADGFTISYVTEGVEKYLGYTTTASNRRLAFGEEYATTLWTVVADPDGGFALSSAFDGGNYVISQNTSTAASAIRGYKSGAIYVGLYLFADAKGEAAPVCEHTNTSEIAAVEATCTTNGNTAGVKCDDCGEIISGNETIAALGHTMIVTGIVDGFVVEECEPCGGKWNTPLSTIAEAKAYTSETLVYYVKGVVTYINGRTVYIEDENDGLCVYFNKNVNLSDLNLGDELLVDSTMTNYKGLLELDNPYRYTVLSTGNALPENSSVTLTELLADTTNTFLGERVTISGLTVGAIDAKGTTTLTDAEGNAITLYAAAGIEAIAVEGDTVTVTAIVSAYNGYQLIINPGTLETDFVVETAEQPQEPTVIEGLKLNHTLNLASDISINYAVPMATVADYESYYVECIVPTYVGNELTDTTTVKIDAVENGFYYYFTLTGITAIQMNDIIEARLYMVKDGVTYVSPVDIYSVATYAYAQMNKTTVTRELQCLCADLLRYGASAQTFKAYRTDALADAAMTEAHKAFLSDIDAVTFNSNKGDLGDFENPSITWAGRALDLNSKVVVKFAFTVNDPSINVEDLTAKITYVNYKGETVTATVETAELYIAASGVYAFSFDQLLAAELRSVLNCVVYNGDTRISSTSYYSVDTYGNGKSGALLDVCKALIAYSDTALIFFNSL